MTGYKHYNYPMFNNAHKSLKKRGFKSVINPAKNYRGKNYIVSRDMYMKKSFRQICRSKQFLLLPGWENSKGALLELMMAVELELPIFLWNKEGKHEKHVDSIEIYKKVQKYFKELVAQY